MVTFEQPFFLLLLLPVGAGIFLTWRRMSLPFPRWQRLLILGTRLLLFTLIICALAGTAFALPVSRQAVVFVGDISASTTAQRTFIADWINTAIKHKKPDDQVGIVAVGRNALVEQSVRNQVDFSRFQSTPDTNFTDLAAGLRLAAAILPTDSQRRIVLLSDGQQNLGDALQEAQLLQQEGIRLDVVPLPSSNGAEARIDDLTAPTELRSNQRFLLHVKVSSTVAQTATLRGYLDETLLFQQAIPLVVGQQEITYSLPAPPPGFHTYRITLEAPFDTLLENNVASTFVNVQGPPRVLVIEGKQGEGANIIAALQAAHIEVAVGTPSDIPTTLDGLANYGAVVLADVPAVALGTARMQILQAFVRDLGRGLVVSGGENSYGVGGYAGTPLEQTLPVKMYIPQHKDNPSIAVVLIVESLESEATVNISKEAAKGVINLLTPKDQVGVSAAYGTLTVPMQHVTDRGKIDSIIDSMNPDDPGSYLPDLMNAEAELLKTDAKIKHVILLGDGDAYDNNYASQVLKMANEHISVSTVATNANTYTDLSVMQQIATLGKGRFYRADNPATIPQILLQETTQAARRAIINEPFIPAIVGNHPIMTGIGALTDLTGYVATTPKTAAQLVLISHQDDPVLAVWQYGLGRVAAWTSDALGEWTADWLQWSDAARWWANMVTWTLPSPESALNVNTRVVGGTGHLTVDLPPGTQVGTGGQQQVQVRIIAPDLSQAALTLQPTAPERWEGNFPATQVGSYLLQVTWQGPGAGDQGPPGQLRTTTGLVVPYSPEFRTIGTDTRFLTLLAHAGGGSLLAANNYAAAFAANLAPVSTALPITFWLLALAALLLPIDIAARRLANLEFITLTFKWLGNLFKRSRVQLATQVPDTTFDSPLSSLRTKRAERRTRAAGHLQRITPTPPAKPHVQSEPKAEKPASQEVSTAEKLLEAKRKRRQGKTDSTNN